MLTDQQIDDECFINIYKSLYNIKPHIHEFFYPTTSQARKDELMNQLVLINDREWDHDEALYIDKQRR